MDKIYGRLDCVLPGAGLGVESRTAAKDLILNGKITVNGKVIIKPSEKVSPGDRIALSDGSPFYEPKYVSRGGYKLETALDAFGIDMKGKICLDVGASTGGFTDCMLRRGAVKVYALDVGTSQLHKKIRDNRAVVVMEEIDARDAELLEKVDFIAVDVSFISLKLILPCLKRFIKNGGMAAVLIKPQFEAGKIRMKNGILKSEKIREKIIKDIAVFAGSLDYNVVGTVKSKIDGGGGNAEYFLVIGF